ncbi:MAG: RnfABCDGE type electron transport complex subunit B [Candidatus Delongbacteria bacterium]|nr:RnfABCDGE type electron transport complex subunit B [Candidatus Delongbacteria bacterium]MBN2835016.1 RnfABCDGE type electron transport complex subunit B [Candidatus Delongbacteria bacterium]
MDSSIITATVSVGAIGAVLGAVLAYASKVFYVEVDPKITEISEILPQANCGACGYPGCSGYADAVASLKCDINLCTPGGQGVIDKIAKIMGVEASSADPMVAYAACNGTKENAKDRFEYYGVKNCSSAVYISGGHKQCEYGCLGFGDCVEACNFDAIYIDEKSGLPVVDDEKCTGCRACVDACPKGVMKLMPKGSSTFLACNSKAKGKEVSDACSVGCIGCKICSTPKVTPNGSIKMNGDLPEMNYKIEEDYTAVKYKCPKNCFIDKGDFLKSPELIEQEKAEFKQKEAEAAALAKQVALEKAAAAKKVSE